MAELTTLEEKLAEVADHLGGFVASLTSERATLLVEDRAALLARIDEPAKAAALLATLEGPAAREARMTVPSMHHSSGSIRPSALSFAWSRSRMRSSVPSARMALRRS